MYHTHTGERERGGEREKERERGREIEREKGKHRQADRQKVQRWTGRCGGGAQVRDERKIANTG